MKINPAIYHHSVYLDSEKLESPDEKCPFCASTNRKAIYLLQNEPEVQLLRCTDCHADSASRMPTDSALAEYYGNYYDSTCMTDQDEKITFSSVTRFGRHLAANIRRYLIDSHVSILDFGGGDGSLSHALAVELLKGEVTGVDIAVVDYNKHMVAPKDKRISITRKNTLDKIASHQNIVIASAVVEHLSKPRNTLNGLTARVKPGGIFYARTPYVVPLMTQMSRLGIKIDFTFPAHVHDLGQEFWESYFSRILNNENFRILKSKPSIVATTFGDHFLKTLAAYLLKAPWHIMGRSYKFVGGWEVFAQKN